MVRISVQNSSTPSSSGREAVKLDKILATFGVLGRHTTWLRSVIFTKSRSKDCFMVSGRSNFIMTDLEDLLLLDEEGVCWVDNGVRLVWPGAFGLPSCFSSCSFEVRFSGVIGRMRSSATHLSKEKEMLTLRKGKELKFHAFV